MKIKLSTRFIFVLLVTILFTISTALARGQQTAPDRQKPASAQQPLLSPVKKKDSEGQPAGGSAKSESSVPELLTQGKTLYRSAKFKQALVQFETALKQDPNHDEALGLAAVTAFRLDNQAQARDYFLRRAELSNQKPSVKAYCFYHVALTYWRSVHDIVAAHGNLQGNRTVYQFDESERQKIAESVTSGLEQADRALAFSGKFAESYNIKNLLHSEGALAAQSEADAQRHRAAAVDSLRKAIAISETGAAMVRDETIDFNQPTIRIGEIPLNKETDVSIDDQMLRMIEGGKPIKRMMPSFPTVRTPKTSAPATEDPAVENIKVEVLIATSGDVVFAHIVDGRPDLNSAAVLAARNWKFEPARFEGAPVQISGVITFEKRAKR